MVIHEYRGSCEPLAIELAPDGLAPACVGHCEVEAVFAEVVPIDSGDKVTEGVGVVVGDHLGLPAGAAGEVHQHYVVVGVDLVGTHELRGGVPLGVEIVEAFRHLWSYAYQDFDRRALRHGLAHVSEHLGIAAADYRLDGGAVVPVDYVVSGEKVGGGDSHGAQLAEGQHREPVLIAALEDEHHHIPAAYA